MGSFETNPTLKHIVRRTLREQGWPTSRNAMRQLKPVDFAINERASYARVFAERAENGVVAFCRSGMDCDCTQYVHTEHMPVPTSLFAWVRGEDERQQWLDGPESSWIGKPSEYPKYHAQADRALEAYENGHPHSVSWGTL